MFQQTCREGCLEGSAVFFVFRWWRGRSARAVDAGGLVVVVAVIAGVCAVVVDGRCIGRYLPFCFCVAVKEGPSPEMPWRLRRISLSLLLRFHLECWYCASSHARAGCLNTPDHELRERDERCCRHSVQCSAFLILLNNLFKSVLNVDDLLDKVLARMVRFLLAIVNRHRRPVLLATKAKIPTSQVIGSLFL